MQVVMNLVFSLANPHDVVRFQNVSKALVQPTNIDSATGEPLSQEVTVYATAENQLQAVDRVTVNKDPAATVKTENLADVIRDKVQQGMSGASAEAVSAEAVPAEAVPAEAVPAASVLDDLPTNDTSAPSDPVATTPDVAESNSPEALKERIRALLVAAATSDKVTEDPTTIKANAAKAAGVSSFREVTAELAPKVISYLEGLLA